MGSRSRINNRRCTGAKPKTFSGEVPFPGADTVHLLSWEIRSSSQPRITKQEVQSVLCYDRHSGRRIWKTDVHRGGFPQGGNKKSNLGSATVASDGRRVFINFLNGGAVYTTALSRDGKQLWQTKISDFILHQGFGSSPAVFESLVVASADNQGGGALAALDRASGKIVWRQERPKTANYTSPIILYTCRPRTAPPDWL